MMISRLRILPALLTVPLALAACVETLPPDDGASASSSSFSSSRSSVASVPATRNVTYQGTIEPAGISIYQEGSHRLALDDGRFLLLESDTITLSTYEDSRVQVTGSLRPTVEAGGLIMAVDRIVSMETSSSLASVTSIFSSSLSSSSQDSLPASSAEAVSSASSVPHVSSIAAVSSVASSVPSSQSSSAPASAASSVSGVVSAAMESRIEAMASADLSSTNWTREYCTEHIGFCIPIHRNWYFVSFGATTSSLWHVEVSSQEIDGLGSGPVRINLVSGETAADGTVSVNGSTVTGYRAWTENRHFEISADARLDGIVRYITQQLAALPVADE